MEADRFDILTRRLSDPRSRRQGLRAALGGALGLLGLAETAAQKGKGGKKNKKKDERKQPEACPGGGTRCGTECVNIDIDRFNCGGCDRFCTESEECINRTCQSCPPGQRHCGQACVDTTNNPVHCGDCSTVCGENEECVLGRCICPGPRCPVPGAVGSGRCCPVARGVCCEGGTCCPDNLPVCQPGGRCCAQGYYSCGDGRCCPNGTTCGGNCLLGCC